MEGTYSIFYDVTITPIPKPHTKTYQQQQQKNIDS